MAELLFAFDQAEMNALIESSANDDIKLSLFPAKDPTDGKKRLFLAAVPATPVTGAVIKKIPVGCPVPPGWSKIIPTVTLKQLENTPSFILPAGSKSTLKDNKSGDQLIVALEGSTNTNFLETSLSFRIKDVTGKTANEIKVPLN